MSVIVRLNIDNHQSKMKKTFQSLIFLDKVSLYYRPLERRPHWAFSCQLRQRPQLRVHHRYHAQPGTGDGHEVGPLQEGREDLQRELCRRCELGANHNH